MPAPSVFASNRCNVKRFAFRHGDCRCIVDILVWTYLVPRGGDGGNTVVVGLQIVEALEFLILLFFLNF